jgi:hypothetical protein
MVTGAEHTSPLIVQINRETPKQFSRVPKPNYLSGKNKQSFDVTHLK